MCACIPLHGNIQLSLQPCRRAALLQVMILVPLIKSGVSSDLGLFLGPTLLCETEVLPAALRRLSSFM